MDFRLHPKQHWNAFSRFQGSAGESEEELQGLNPVSQLRVEPGRSPLSPALQPNRQSSAQPLDLNGLDFSDATEYAGTPSAAVAEGFNGSSGAGPGGNSNTNSPWIILPEGQFRTGWIYIQLAVAMYIVWVTPVRVGFNIPSEGLWFWFEGMVDLFFYIDLVLNFFTAYEDKYTGELVTDHKAIAARYLTGWFAVDLLATFPVDYLIRAVEGSWMCSLRGDCSWAILHGTSITPIALLRLLRFFRIMWILKHVKFMRFATLLGGLADDLYAILPVLSILELVIILIYLGHISGCFFYLLSTPPWQTPTEKHLIATGEMTTWIQHAFGGDRIIMPPYDLNITRYLSPNASLSSSSNSSSLNSKSSNNSTWLRSALARPLPPTATQGPKGNWWVCPDFGYDMVSCPSCEGPPMRCKSHYHLFFRYITSMYWAYTTMTTVGYGDISSTTLAEKIWAIITMIVSGFFFSFVVGRMASIVAKLDSHRTAYNERMEVVTAFLKDTNLPRQMSKRVLDMFKKQTTKPYDRQAVLGILPFELKAKILRHLYAGAIRDVPLLCKFAEDDLFVTDMCIRLQDYTCPANTFVYQRGEPGGDVFIMMRGELLQLDVDKETTIAKIPEGSVFGETVVLRNLEGFADAKRVTNMWCKTPCYMLRISRADMHDLLQQYPQLLETIKTLNLERRNNSKAAKRMKASASSPQLQPAGSAPQLSSLAAGSASIVLPHSNTNSNSSSRPDLIKVGREEEAAAAAAAIFQPLPAGCGGASLPPAAAGAAAAAAAAAGGSDSPANTPTAGVGVLRSSGPVASAPPFAQVSAEAGLRRPRQSSKDVLGVEQQQQQQQQQQRQQGSPQPHLKAKPALRFADQPRASDPEEQEEGGNMS